MEINKVWPQQIVLDIHGHVQNELILLPAGMNYLMKIQLETRCDLVHNRHPEGPVTAWVHTGVIWGNRLLT